MWISICWLFLDDRNTKVNMKHLHTWRAHIIMIIECILNKKISHRRWPWCKLHQMLWKKVAQTKKKRKTSNYRLDFWQKNLSWFPGSWMLKYFTSNQVKNPTFSLGSLGVCYIHMHDHAWEQCPVLFHPGCCSWELLKKCWIVQQLANHWSFFKGIALCSLQFGSI